MAELSASVALATAVVKLSQFLREQAGFVLDVKDDVEKLMKELKWMQAFLKDAENKVHKRHLIQQWVSDVEDLACDCEDVIDTFDLELEEGERKTHAGCLGAMSSCCFSTTNLHNSHKLSRQIKNLMAKLNEISSRRGRYALNADACSTSESYNADRKLMDLRRSAPYANHEHFVGLAESISLLTTEITNGISGRFIISIYGMGGIGKTTLSRKLYDTLRHQHFESYAWICVTQVYDTQDILLQLFNSIMPPTESYMAMDWRYRMPKDAMESYLIEFLRRRRFLVVIDDVWNREVWESLERAFPDNNNGSRVIITTRHRRVAALNNAYVHELRYLDEDEDWELFCKRAFLNSSVTEISGDLVDLGKEMVAKCLGLPLAIVTLGGLLAMKSKTLREWTLVKDNFWKELEKDSMHIGAALSLSFNDLPYYLKPCFLYVGMFPNDLDIPVSKLILLWVAEGFVGSEMGSPESVAKSYFDELVGRSLFQIKGEDWIGSTFRVHDLLRDLAIKKAEDIRFSVYCDEKQLYNLTRAAPHRRLAAFHPAFRSLQSRYINPSLRTLFIGSTGKDLRMDGRHFDRIFDDVLISVPIRFGYLKVIDIQVHYGDDSKPQELPSEIGSMIHLRYLGLHLLKSATRELHVPDTIGNLKALQTLSVTSDLILSYCTLPSTMEKLQTLRHLIGNFHLGDWIGKLIALETLQEITYEQWCGIDTTNLVNLHHLSLTSVPQLQASPERFYEKFQTTKKLQTLSLENPEVFELASISVLEIFKCCLDITHFKTSGINFANSSDLHEFAINLEVLDIVYYKNPEVDPIPLIERLPALRALRMVYYSAYDQMIVCSENGFPRLLVIEIDHNVVFSVAEGGMPLLTSLRTKASHKIEAPQRLMDLIVMF